MLKTRVIFGCFFTNLKMQLLPQARHVKFVTVIKENVTSVVEDVGVIAGCIDWIWERRTVTCVWLHSQLRCLIFERSRTEISLSRVFTTAALSCRVTSKCLLSPAESLDLDLDFLFHVLRCSFCREPTKRAYKKCAEMYRHVAFAQSHCI